ncbi:MAG TPA: peptide deformylase [Syntrophomonadaceae bacterium]|nr:peptide deformylase [Syntrophomonadaceae bacterium]
MSVYKVITVPNDILRQKAKPVKKVNAGVLRLLDNMKDTMYAFDGVGLAAPQIGVSKRVVVVDTGEDYYELINPLIISADGEQLGQEGCLSVPGVVGNVNRSKNVTVKAMNRDGEEISIAGTDLLARALQHEIDHLDGILFIDKIEEVVNEDNRLEE